MFPILIKRLIIVSGRIKGIIANPISIRIINRRSSKIRNITAAKSIPSQHPLEYVRIRHSISMQPTIKKKPFFKNPFVLKKKATTKGIIKRRYSPNTLGFPRVE